MRKSLIALACLYLMTGLATAAEVTLVKFDKESKTLKVKEGDQEKSYRVTDKTKFSAVDKSGNSRELAYTDALKGLCSPAAEGTLRFDIAIKDGNVTEAKLKGRKGKN